MTTPYQAPDDHQALPTHRPQLNHKGHKVTKGIQPEGESGRKGIHPWHFPRICFRSASKLSMATNVLWPFVPVAIVLHFAYPDLHLWIFIMSYIAMVPAANLIGFAGQELARKMPRVSGVIMELAMGSAVEIILLIALVVKGAKHKRGNYVIIIQSAILGSILANLLLCLGTCFFAGGIRKKEQKFHDAVTDVGTGLLLVAAMGLVIPAAFSSAGTNINALDPEEVYRRILSISRATAVILMVAFAAYMYFNLRSHHGVYDNLLEEDEKNDADRERNLAKDKLTLTECIIALLVAVACVALLAEFLVKEIEYIVCHRGVTDEFMGLILVPLVEKFSEHLVAIDEAWDNRINFALSHVLGASVQTALFNGPLAVLVAWGMGFNLDLNFGVFDSVVLVLAVLLVGNFVRDGKSNYLEGLLCVLIYIIVSVGAFYLPNPSEYRCEE